MGSRLSYSTYLEDPDLILLFDLNIRACFIFNISNLNGFAQEFLIALIDAILEILLKLHSSSLILIY